MRKLLLKGAIFGALALGILVGIATTTAQAQTMQPQAFVIQAGAGGPGNIEILAFAPQMLQVHRGDTVTWSINGFHNVRFDSKPTDLVIAPEVDGKPLPQINPVVAFPSFKSGDKYSGGAVGSGLPDPSQPPFFSVVIDLEPGTYSYLCDVHPGMVGVIAVVADDQAISSPSEVALQASAEFGGSINAAIAGGLKLEADTMALSPDKANQVLVGSGGDLGRATINLFFPGVTTIKAGQSVTWTIAADGIEPHTVSWPPVRGQDVVPMPQEGKPPILAVGPSLAPMTQSGATVKKGEAFSSGLFLPGQTFTLTFSEPGVYPYTCNIHPAMNGVVVVEAAQ